MPPATARPKTRETLVDSPWGGSDRVERIAEVLDGMLARKQLDSVEHAAGLRFRTAYQHIASGRLRSAIDDIGMPHQAPHGGSLPRELAAASILDEAKRMLGEIDFKVVADVAGMGYSIAEAAGHIFKTDGRPQQRIVDHTGHRLRVALATLGRRWYGTRRRTISGSSFRDDDARPLDAVVGEREIPVSAQSHVPLRRGRRN